MDLIKQIPIPIASKHLQDEIGNFVYQAYDKRAEALILEDQAQEIFAKALNIPKEYI